MDARRALTEPAEAMIDDEPIDPAAGDGDFPPAELQALIRRADADAAAGRGRAQDDVLAFLDQLRAELAAR